MRKIPLTQGQVAFVDDDDYEMVSAYKWFAHWNRTGHSFYAYTNINVGNGRKTLAMHNLIVKTPSNMQIDHINHDTLDNKRGNLRLCTKSQNMMNKKCYHNNTSGYKGVHWNPQNSKWRAQIQFNKKKKHLGYYNTPQDAAMAYDCVASKMYGEYALLNKIGV
jgi:hypothetical protein